MISEKRSLIFWIAMVGVIFVGASFFFLRRKPEVQLRNQPSHLVEVAPVQTGSVSRRVTVNGTLVASQSVTIVSELEGRILSVLFKQGEKVKKGDVLIQMDPASDRVLVKESEAKVTLAKSEHQRAQMLLEKGFGTPVACDRALSALRVAEAELERTSLRLSQTRICAPFDGAVGLQKVSAGAWVGRNQELVSLVSANPIYLDFAVAESYARELHVSKSVSALIDGADSLPFIGPVIAIDPRADPVTHSVSVRAQLENGGDALKPGQFARVALELGRVDDALLVPEVAIEHENDTEQDFVYRIVSGVAVRTEVHVGLKEDERVQIVKGLKAGDVIVTAGHMKLRDGSLVRVKGDSGGNVKSVQFKLSRGVVSKKKLT